MPVLVELGDGLPFLGDLDLLVDAEVGGFGPGGRGGLRGCVHRGVVVAEDIVRVDIVVEEVVEVVARWRGRGGDWSGHVVLWGGEGIVVVVEWNLGRFAV